MKQEEEELDHKFSPLFPSPVEETTYNFMFVRDYFFLIFTLIPWHK